MQAYQGHYLVGNLSPEEHQVDESYPAKDREIIGWKKVLKQLKEIEERRSKKHLASQYSRIFAKGGTKKFDYECIGTSKPRHASIAKDSR